MTDQLRKENQETPTGRGDFLSSNVQRRSFLKYAGAGAAGLALTAAGCKVHHITAANTLDLGKGDFGILNYAYALEQLEAAFYIKVVDNFYSGVSPIEREFLTDIRNDEIAHREWFKKVLFLNKVQDLTWDFDFSSVNFNSRDSVLSTAKALEDTGVSAYNGAGKLLTIREFLHQAGKIVSVEARHAAAIRDLISYGSFADSDAVDANGLDLARSPQEVLSIAGKFFKSKIDGSHLPTS